MAKMTRTWWGETFLEVLSMSMDYGRLRRGRSYSGPNRLLKFTIRGSAVSATVRGNINPYFGVYEEPRYKVSVKLRKFTPSEWNGITDAISHNAACLSQLLMNEMPTAIDDVFSGSGKSLLPKERADLIGECSCPDWATPCKHVAGVYYKIASLLDRDPMLLFQLRGMEFSQLQKKLAKSPLGQALIDQQGEDDQVIEHHAHRFTQPRRIPSPEISLKNFWKGEHPVPLVEVVGGPPATPAVLVKRGGDYPAFWHGDQSFIGVMETIYTRVVAKNKSSL